MTKREHEDDPHASLKRIEQQSEKIITGWRDDAPAGDKIEILGKRIARILSVILTVGLIIYLWRTYLAA